MNTPQAYPLLWPLGWPRTETTKREYGRFKCSLAGALGLLKEEVRRMGGKNLVLSSNYTLGCENPKEAGVVAYFHWDGVDLAIPCDRWTRVEHNVQAIALTIKAMRGMERWGAKHMIKSMFTGFKQIGNGETWWRVLEIEPAATMEQIKEAYRTLVLRHHPDRGGKHEDFLRIQQALNDALVCVASR